jgi:phage major head subunit gpT-like protein
MLITPSNIAFAFQSLDTLYQQVIQDTPVYWPDIASEVRSTTEQEFHAWLKRIPELREWIGERRVNQLSANVQALKNRLFEDTFAIPRTKFEDDQYGIFAPQAVKDLARAAKIWPDNILTAAIIAGTSALAHDGQAFFSASHPVNPDVAGSPTQANLQTSKALTAQNFSDVRAVGESFLGEDSVPLGLEFDTLIVPPALKNTALQLANADLLAAALGANAATGSQTNVLKGTIKKVVVLPRLTADSLTTWYLACTNRAVKPFIFQNRMPAEFSWLNKPEDPNVFRLDEYQYGVRARGAAGYGPWFLCIKCTA